jgi:hypothetical protein
VPKDILEKSMEKSENEFSPSCGELCEAGCLGMFPRDFYLQKYV